MSMLDLHSKLGTRLRRIRVKSGLTLTELSIRMRNDRFSASTISQYERGKKAFDLDTVLIFCHHLNTPLFVFLKNIKNPWSPMLKRILKERGIPLKAFNY